MDYEDWKDDLEAEYPELTEDERMMKMYEINGEYLGDERINLNIQLYLLLVKIKKGDLASFDVFH